MISRVDTSAHSMHTACMATKTISLRLDAYERLRAARRSDDESFTQVILRAQWPEPALSGADLLARLQSKGATFAEEALQEIDKAKIEQTPPDDKWNS